MARTTLDIADPVLRDLKKLQAREGKSLGQIVTELLAQALDQPKGGRAKARPFHWNVSRGRLLVDLEDAEAVAAILDADAKARLQR